MIETIQLSQATCDGCGRVRLGHPGVANVPGLMGAIVRVNDDGTGAEQGHTEFFACRDRCIGNAARNALAFDNGSADGQGAAHHTQPELT